MRKMDFSLVLVISLVATCWCLPPQRRFSDQEFNDIVEHEKPKEENSSTNTSTLDELGIEYSRYLQEVIDTLEKDESFKKKLETAPESDVRTAKIAEELEYVDHHVRSKLDELKRTELHRLRELAKQAYGSEHELHFNPPGHMDHENTETFEIQDLKKLIHQVAQDLEDTDKKRKQMFKQYEMQKHFEREQKLQSMNDEDKKKFLHEEEAAKRKEEEAKKRVHHPGSKQQLQEVWEEQDHMNKDDFNPKTFFVMHDVDGNGFLDEEEVKSLFLKELDKLYSQGVPQADLMERAEEMERMREHVFKEVDKNRDRLISWEEFHEMSLKPEFNQDPGWQPIDNQPVYTQEELINFERQRLAELEQLQREGKLPPGYHIPVLHDQMNNSFYAYHPGDPNIHNPAYYQQIPIQHPLHSQESLHGQQQQYQHQQFQQLPQLQQQQLPQLQQQQLTQLQQQQQHQFQPQHPQFQQQHIPIQQQHIPIQQQHPQLQQQHQQQQQQHQQFQPIQQQQFYQPQLHSMQGIPQQPGVVPPSNFAHQQQVMSQASLVHPQQPVASQNVYHQPHVQPPIASNHVTQSVNAIPQQPVISQQSVSGSNVYQQQVVPQQVNLAQQPILAQQPNLAQPPNIPQQPNVPQEHVAEGQLFHQSQPAPHQAVPQSQVHSAIQGEPPHDGKAVPIVNEQTQMNNQKV